MIDLKTAVVLRTYFKAKKKEIHWSSEYAQYYWSPSGEPLVYKHIKANLDEYNNSIKTIVGLTADNLATERIELGTWQSIMTDHVKDSWIINYAVGKGGFDAMTNADWVAVTDGAEKQLSYLNKFANEIGRGELSPAQIAARSQLYAKAPWQAYQQGRQEAAKTAGFTEEHRAEVNDSATCGDCREWDAKGWQPIGTIPPPGLECQCGANCRGEFEFRGGAPAGGRPSTMGDPDAFIRQDWEQAETLEWSGMKYDTFTTDSTIEQKRQLCTELANRSGIDYDTVTRFIHQWAETSNDSAWASLHIQSMAAEEFGVPLSEWQKKQIALLRKRELIEEGIGHGFVPTKQILSDDDTRRLLRTMYDHTQEQLQAAGIKEITLHRGITDYSDKWADIFIGDTIALDGNAIESWSLKQGVASVFGNRAVTVTVPAEEIIGCSRTGFGCLNEWEFVLLNNEGREALVWAK